MSTVLESAISSFLDKQGVGVARARDIKPLGLNAQKVVSKRYSLRDENGEPFETWPDIVRRVVGHVSKAEKDEIRQKHFYNEMAAVMLAREFIPNTPCLVNAGKPKGQLAACFVLEVPDSIEGIMEHAQNVAIIHQTGGGTGMTYEFLRPAGSMVNSTRGVASGPVSFMNIVNQTTEVVKQGGVRRGANMGILRISHPDILRFIHAKNDQTSLTNFNISVTVTDLFMDAVDSGTWFQTEFNDEPWTQPIFDAVTGTDYVVYRRPDGTTATFADKLAFETADLSDCTIEEPPIPGMVYAPDIWNRIIASAHKYAEPGIIFIDEVNRHNHLMASMGPIYACNPCGEQQLHFNNSCNLGSIDVAKFYREAETGEPAVDWERLSNVTQLSTQFLDNAIDAGYFPLPAIDDVVKRTRPVGLGRRLKPGHGRKMSACPAAPRSNAWSAPSACPERSRQPSLASARANSSMRSRARAGRCSATTTSRSPGSASPSSRSTPPKMPKCPSGISPPTAAAAAATACTPPSPPAARAATPSTASTKPSSP